MTLRPTSKVFAPFSVLRDLAVGLRELETVTNDTNHELAVARLATVKGRESAEQLLDRALASMEHLNEISAVMTRRLDALLKT
jgi:hypothetical protein